MRRYSAVPGADPDWREYHNRRPRLERLLKQNHHVPGGKDRGSVEDGGALSPKTLAPSAQDQKTHPIRARTDRATSALSDCENRMAQPAPPEEEAGADRAQARPQEALSAHLAHPHHSAGT